MDVIFFWEGVDGLVVDIVGNLVYKLVDCFIVIVCYGEGLSGFEFVEDGCFGVVG